MILAMVVLLIIGMLAFIGLLKTYNSIYYYIIFLIITIVFILSIITGINGNVLFTTIDFHDNIVHVIRYLFIFTMITNFLVLIVLAFVGKTKKVGFTFIYFIFTLINVFISTLCISDIFLEEDLEFIVIESYGSFNSLIIHHIIEYWYFLILGIFYSIAFIIYQKRKSKFILDIKKED